VRQLQIPAEEVPEEKFLREVPCSVFRRGFRPLAFGRDIIIITIIGPELSRLTSPGTSTSFLWDKVGGMLE
jgi:hypothetical protein